MPQGPARGHTQPSGMVQISTRFDPDTFEEIRAKATTDNTSIADAVRTLCEWGLEAENDGRE